jgi:hypothetical protein
VKYARGVVWIHSAANALCPHVEWALSKALGQPTRLAWSPQPAQVGTRRAEYSWTGAPGTGERLASALLGLGEIRFEVCEDAAMRWAYTPSLGVHAAVMGPGGDLMVSEHRLRAAMDGAGDLRATVADLLGEAWDGELEPFRMAGEGAVWLHKVS